MLWEPLLFLTKAPVNVTFRLKIQITKKSKQNDHTCPLQSLTHPSPVGIDRLDIIWHLTNCCNWQIANLLSTVSSEVLQYREVVLEKLLLLQPRPGGRINRSGRVCIMVCCSSDRCDQCFLRVCGALEQEKRCDVTRSVISRKSLLTESLIMFLGSDINCVNGSPVSSTFTKVNLLDCLETANIQCASDVLKAPYFTKANEGNRTVANRMILG